jgi:hypothetical protein
MKKDKISRSMKADRNTVYEVRNTHNNSGLNNK